jgi:hypothetical protein
MILEDGTGSGRKLAINENNRAEVESTIVPYPSRINQDTGKVWSISLEGLAPSGATWFLAFFNSGSTTYAISQMMMVSSVAGVFRASKITGTPAGGTTIVPTSLNLSKTVLLDLCTVESGTSITGLTEGSLIAPIYLPQYQPVILPADSLIIIPPGTVGLGIKAPAAATVNGFITVFETVGE